MFNISNKIKSTARSSSGRLDSLAKFLIDYIETGDEALLIASDDISFTGMSSLCDMSNFDYSGFSWSEKESRLLKLALRRAKRNFADPEKYLKPFYWEEFGSSVFEAAGYIMYHREAFRNDHLCDGFLDGLKDAGIPAGDIFWWITSGGGELSWAAWFKSDFGTTHQWKTGFEQYVWNLPDDVLFPRLRQNIYRYHPLVMALARYQPETMRRWVVHLKSHLDPGIGDYENILIDLLGVSGDFDAEIVELMTFGGDTRCLYALHKLRPDAYSEQKIAIALKSPQYTLGWLARHCPETALECLATMIKDGRLKGTIDFSFNNREVLILAASDLQGRGRSIFEGLLDPDVRFDVSDVLRYLAENAPKSESAYVQNYIDRLVAQTPPDDIGWIWSELSGSPHYLAPYIEDLKEGLKNKELVSRASGLLQKLLGDGYEVYCGELLTSSDKTEQSLGFSLLKEAGTDKAHHTLLEVLATTPDRKLADMIRRTFRKRGIPFPGERRSEAESNSLAIPVLVKWRSFLSAPRITWLDRASLPKLRNKAGGELDETAAWFVLEKDNIYYLQHCPDLAIAHLELLVSELDPQSVADFSLHVLKAWLGSDQKAKDGRWAMRLAGILGDDRVIEELVPRIHEWCGGSRRQLGEIAVEAISRLPGDTLLAVLNDLVDHYKGKTKSMFEACATALYFAADARGITPRNVYI